MLYNYYQAISQQMGVTPMQRDGEKGLHASGGAKRGVFGVVGRGLHAPETRLGGVSGRRVPPLFPRQNVTRPRGTPQRRVTFWLAPVSFQIKPGSVPKFTKPNMQSPQHNLSMFELNT
jgi:hypothetical protein